jgi:hypothetical protein
MTLKTIQWEDRPDKGPVFEARYPGNCEGCGEHFDEGESVFYKDGDLYVDHGCDDEAEVRPQTCPQCFQTFSKSGACGCG